MGNLFPLRYHICGIVFFEFFAYNLLGGGDPCVVPILFLKILELMPGMKN
jgi:hypothetical protein